MKDKKIPWKILVSAILVFHLFGVFVTPNPRSYLMYAISPVYRPYMNFLGLNGSWGFFAPEPIAPPLYIDYVLQQKEGTAITGRFPNETNPYFFRDRHNRRMSLARFMVMNDDHMRNMFMTYICAQYPNTTEAKIWKVVGTQPTLEMVQKGEKKMTDAVDYKIEVLGTYYCLEKKHG